MSERQAKKIRKENPVSENTKRKKTKSEILTNSIIAVLVIAFIGLGSWAVYSKFDTNKDAVQNETVTDTGADAGAEEQAQATTVAQAAEEAGMSTEDYLAEYGLDSIDDITGDTEMSVAVEYMTFANYAKLSGTDTATLRESAGLDDSISDDTPMSEVFAAIQSQSDAQSEETEAEQTEAEDDTAQTEGE